VLSGVRWLAGIAQSAEVWDEITGGIPFGLFLLAASAPVLAPITEEIVFRHVLFYKFRGRPVLCALMCVCSAVLFGAIHYNNFDGDLFLTVPYMAIAVIYNLLYLFSKNIWTSTMTHLIFNFSQSLLPAMLIPLIVMLNQGG
jgi:membrane protease YdiL (CAAX protease family)